MADFSKYQAIADDVAKQVDMYYLQHGQSPLYGSSNTDFSTWVAFCPTLDLPEGCSCNTYNSIFCNNKYTVGMHQSEHVGRGPVYATSGINGLVHTDNSIYYHWPQYSYYPNKRECCARTNSSKYDKVANFCESLSKKEPASRVSVRCWELN
jgi:hypothetical protein